MKKFEYLALKSHEFIDMVEAAARSRTTLKIKKKEEKCIVVACQVAVPVVKIKYKTEEHNENLTVHRSINWFPLFYSTIPVLALLEVIVFLFDYFGGGLQWFSYLLVGLAWVLGIIFILYHIFTEIETLTQKMFKVKV